jgi:hypothetical protein
VLIIDGVVDTGDKLQFTGVNDAGVVVTSVFYTVHSIFTRLWRLL